MVIESTTASAEARRGAIERLRGIHARGSTNLAEGWLRGCEQVANHLSATGVNRCLLLTDGLANVGITDRGELAIHATELRARGVSTSTIGVGNDFDEALLQELADAGGGHFYYVADAPQIHDAITSEVGETLEVVARDVSIEVTARDDIRITPISPYKATGRGSRTLVSLGDLAAEQAVEVVLRLSFPFGDPGRETGAILALTDRDGAFAPGAAGGVEPVRLTWTYADHRANDNQSRDGAVDRAVARSFAARARQEAIARNRAGDLAGAGGVLSATADRIRDYAGDDPVMLGVLETLERETSVYAAPMPNSPANKRISRAPTPCAAVTPRVIRSGEPEAASPTRGGRSFDRPQNPLIRGV